MNLELNNTFYNLDSYNSLELPLIKHLTFKELKNDFLLKNLFREFVEQVLKGKDIWGRNKLSNELNSISNYSHHNIIQKIYNFNTFQDYNFKHYHLVGNDRRSDSNIGKISDIRNNYNTCGTLIHYQLLHDKIIIHSIGKHENGEWDELFKLINPNYCELTTCQTCGTNFTTYKDMHCPCCSANPVAPIIKNTNTLLKLKSNIGVGAYADAIVIKADDIKKEKDKEKSDNALKAIMLTANLFKENIKSKANKVISSIEEINHELDKI